MLTVSHDLATVDSQLFDRVLHCPLCSGALKPWGFGAGRIIRHGIPMVNRRFTPRRARCGDCKGTHILLPVLFAARRADEAAVIAKAVELSTVDLLGHRRIAARLGRPESTVRDWLRDFKASAAAKTAAFAARVHRATADALGFWPAPASTAGANAVSMLMAHARMLAHQHHFGPGPVVTMTWHDAALFAHGPWFFSTTGWPESAQHQSALMPGR